MHPAIKQLTPAQALDLMESSYALQTWFDDNDIPFKGKYLAQVAQLAEECNDAPSPSDWRRGDADRLREFVQRAVRLPMRQRQVARLLLDYGASLTDCADELGISRETVRTHLRRLREAERRSRRATR